MHSYEHTNSLTQCVKRLDVDSIFAYIAFHNALFLVIYTGIRSQNSYWFHQECLHLKTEHFRNRLDDENAARHLQACLSGRLAKTKICWHV